LKGFLSNKKLNKKKAKSLIDNLSGIKKTQQLAEKYHIKTIECAKRIKNKAVCKEMIELANVAINREK
jgi:geranylgeranyl pyrophosphate synthase